MIPTTVKNFKNIRDVRVTCPGWFKFNYPMKLFFSLVIVAMNTVKMLPIFIAAVVRETSKSSKSSFIKIMLPISPNYNLENGVKQIKITVENFSQLILCQLLRTKNLALGSKCIKHFFNFYQYLPYICWVEEWMWFI